MVEQVFNVIGSIIVLATITTLILPGRQTAPVVNAFGNALSSSIKTAQGR